MLIKLKKFKTMNLTWLDSNSWLIEMGGQNILLDPWLVGSLTFGNFVWLFKGEKRFKREIPAQIDLILLSQGLEDHAHPPTLKELGKNIPVVGSPGAAKVAKELEYTQVTTLNHTESFKLGDQVEIMAVPGSPVGPTTTENGYVIKDLASGKTIYYEPHGYHSKTLKDLGSINAIITPIIDLKLPLLGAVIKGQKSALEVCQWLKPEFIIPTAGGGDIVFEGLLMSFLRAEGSVEEFQSLLSEKNLSTRVIDPKPGEGFAVF